MKFKFYKKKIDNFFLKLKKISRSHPLITVLILHEYFRNIYPSDLFIKKRYKEDQPKNFDFLISELELLIKIFAKIGGYNSKFKTEKVLIQNLFGSLWEERMNEFSLDQKKFLKNLFSKLNFNISYLKQKKVLDMGCGSES